MKEMYEHFKYIARLYWSGKFSKVSFNDPQNVETIWQNSIGLPFDISSIVRSNQNTIYICMYRRVNCRSTNPKIDVVDIATTVLNIVVV